MEKINEDNHNMYNILSEDDYDITVEDKGITLNGFIHEKDMMETFTIRNPKAVKADKSLMGKFGEDERHSIWINKDLDKVIELYNPDIVIYECAERVDRSDAVVEFADKIK